MSNNNKNLNRAKVRRYDEFYTDCDVIHEELSQHLQWFKDKTVICDCDDYDSEFTKYFRDNFVSLGLNRLICVWYMPGGRGHLIDASRSNYQQPDFKYLKNSGSFDSEEVLELLQEADIICTNPPFSRLRDYFLRCISSGKQFLILGSLNTLLTSRKTFDVFKHGLCRLGYTIHGGGRKFYTPSKDYVSATSCGVDADGYRWIRIAGVRWFTNFPVRFPEGVDLVCKMDDSYKFVDEPRALCVNRTCEIPYDYDGLMAVPITFMDYYNPEQFEIIDYIGQPKVEGKNIYKRLLIKRVI